MSEHEHILPAPTLTAEEEQILDEKDQAMRAEVDHEIAAEFPPAPEPMVHCMLDLETWGSGNKALPISLGAVKFTEDEILAQFHVGIDPVSGQLFKLEIDADTIMWWMHPDRDEARRAWLSLEKVDLASALVGFSNWLGGGPPIAAIWGNGATFDNVILRSAYDAVGLPYPVRFWQDQCYRTMKNRTPGIEIERVGTHHSALDDAISQAKHLQAILKRLNAPLDHIEKLQLQAGRYIEPTDRYNTFVSDSSNVIEGETETTLQRDRAFIDDMIYLLDGPEQREAMSTRITL